jgi:predicted transcriptional regulator
MDRVLSTRVDEAVIKRIGALARHLNTSKKQVIEDAVRTYAAIVEESDKTDILTETFGAWCRDEPARELVQTARDAFRSSMTRRHR